jgi:hypothetical protein
MRARLRSQALRQDRGMIRTCRTHDGIVHKPQHWSTSRQAVWVVLVTHDVHRALELTLQIGHGARHCGAHVRPRPMPSARSHRPRTSAGASPPSLQSPDRAWNRQAITAPRLQIAAAHECRWQQEGRSGGGPLRRLRYDMSSHDAVRDAAGTAGVGRTAAAHRAGAVNLSAAGGCRIRKIT